MVEVTFEMAVAIIGIAIPIIGLLLEHFYFNASANAAVIERLSKLETKIDLFWNALGQQLAPMLLKGNPISTQSKLYHLLSLYQHKEINNYDIPELVCLLEDESENPDHTPGEVIAMLLLAATLKAKTGEDVPCLK